MKVSPATLDHSKEIHRIHTSAVRTTCKDFYTEEQIEAWLKGRSPEGYHGGIEKGEMYVAEKDGQIIGFGHATPGRIEATYVDPAFHKQGVGRALINHGLQIASKNHGKVMVESTINAEGFYKKHGFVKIKDDALTRNDVKIPTVIMEYKDS